MSLFEEEIALCGGNCDKWRCNDDACRLGGSSTRFRVTTEADELPQNPIDSSIASQYQHLDVCPSVDERSIVERLQQRHHI